MDAHNLYSPRFCMRASGTQLQSNQHVEMDRLGLQDYVAFTEPFLFGNALIACKIILTLTLNANNNFTLYSVISLLIVF